MYVGIWASGLLYTWKYEKCGTATWKVFFSFASLNGQNNCYLGQNTFSRRIRYMINFSPEFHIFMNDYKPFTEWFLKRQMEIDPSLYMYNGSGHCYNAKTGCYKLWGLFCRCWILAKPIQGLNCFLCNTCILNHISTFVSSLPSPIVLTSNVLFKARASRILLSYPWGKCKASTRGNKVPSASILSIN